MCSAKLISAFLLVLFVAFSVQATTYYADPAGSGSTCSLASPCTLAVAKTKPGADDIVMLRGGTYPAVYDLSNDGTSGHYIEFRNYPGELAVIDNPNVDDPGGSLDTLRISGDYTKVVSYSGASFAGIRITNSTTTRTTCNRPIGVLITGVGSKIVGATIDNNGDGVFVSKTAIGAEVYGNIIVNNGWDADGSCFTGTGFTGHGIYPQSNSVGTPELFKENLILNSFGFNFHAYTTSDANALHGFTISGNAIYNAGLGSLSSPNMLIGGASVGAEGVSLDSNFFWQGQIQFGYVSTANSDLSVTNSVMSVGATSVDVKTTWSSVTYTGNTVYGTLSGAGDYLQLLDVSMVGSPFTWDNNAYYLGCSACFIIDGDNWYNFAAWKLATDFDAASTSTVGAPTGSIKQVRASSYDTNRANVILYNWSGGATIAFDPSAFLANGDTYELRSAQDPFGTPALSGTYTSGDLTVTVNALPVAAPNGESAAPSSGPVFSAFQLVRLGSSPPTPGQINITGAKVKGAKIS